MYQKKLTAYNLDREKYLENISHSQEYQFKKGHSGHRRISQKERNDFVKRMDDINKKRKPELCPICNMVFDNLASHLYNKHNMLRVKI